MEQKTIYLTMDDFPSIWGRDKIDFLAKNQIPTLIYARGECLENHLSMAVDAIQKGFLMGNHSYSHPYFSKLTFSQCRTEIEKTERLINQAYDLAGRSRPLKTIRFPFGDPGGEEVETYLKENNFKKAILPVHLEGESLSVPWSVDTLDYKTRLTKNPSLLIQELDSQFKQLTNHEDIVLVHDFDHNQEAFLRIIKYFQDQKVIFKGLEFYL